MSDFKWFAVKCLFHHKDLKRRNGQNNYEERIILIRANSFDNVIELAEKEAYEYCQDLGDEVEYMEYCNAFMLFDSVVTHETEVYSSITRSHLSCEEYITARYDSEEIFKKKEK